MAVCYQFMLFQAKDVVIKKERKEKKHSVLDSRLRNRNNHRIQICICAQALAWITKTRSLFEVIRLSEHKKKHTSLTWIYETRFEKKKNKLTKFDDIFVRWHRSNEWLDFAHLLTLVMLYMISSELEIKLQ